ncbi:unnamed protein product, partial [Polarella glacialis]
EGGKLLGSALRPFGGTDVSVQPACADRHAEALKELAALVDAEITPALCAVATFPAAAERLRRLVADAWIAHASAGRSHLEAFVQKAVFGAIQAFSRHALLAPELGADSDAAGFAHRWLRDMEM